MKEQKLLKAPGGFARSARFIAAALFVVHILFLALIQSSLNILRIADILDNYYYFYVADFSYYLLFIAAILLFNHIKLLPVPFAIFAWSRLVHSTNAINSIAFDIIRGYEIESYEILSVIVNTSSIVIFVSVILLVAFAAIKKTRKLTIVWFIPATLHFLSFFVFGCYAIIDAMPDILSGELSVISNYNSIAVLDIFIGLALVFTGLAIRAYAKQKMYDEQTNSDI